MPPQDSMSVVGSGPHTVSLKVLRLSRPSLAITTPLPAINNDVRLRQASLAYPAQSPDAFPLSPLLTLPPTFGAAYVGETFSCTLCANAEHIGQSGIDVKDVEIMAQLQTPNTQPHGIELDVIQEADNDDHNEHNTLRPGRTLQGIVTHELREEGSHVLAVTVTYVEALHITEVHTEEARPSSRTRTFRKLYQFAAQQAIGVRTKVGELKSGASRRFSLEAQLENLSEHPLVLNDIDVILARSLTSKNLNRHVSLGDRRAKPILAPQDVEQVAFLIEQQGDEDLEELSGRTLVAQLSVTWRGHMGQPGNLKTGWLGSRKR